MIKRLYGSRLLPEIPEEAKKYKYQVVIDYGFYAFNEIRYDSVSTGTGVYFVDYALFGISGSGSNVVWSFSESGKGVGGLLCSYRAGSLNTNPFVSFWYNRDLLTSGGEVLVYGSEPATVEYGFWDGGEGDALSITEFTVPQGFHVTGTWKCIVSCTDSQVAKMEWYRNNTLISTVTGKSDSECRPTADNIGTFTYKCVITFENGKSVTAGDMTVVVEEYDPGEDPGGGGDPDPGGGGGGGDDETSLVTGIDLHVYPDTVVPGGRATIEVTVNGIGNYSQAFTARLSGHASAETELFSAGKSCNVWIAEEETAEYVLVTVASVQDPTITATEMIYIDYSGTEDEGTTQEQLQRAFWKGFAAARAYFREAKVSISASIHIAKDAEPTAKEGKLRRSFWQGFVSALVVESVPDGVLVSADGHFLKDSSGRYLCAEKQPVAMLYNGVRLPPLPEWDEEAYPYAVIYYDNNNANNSRGYHLKVFDSEPSIYSKGNDTLVPYNGGTGRFLHTMFDEGEEISFGDPFEYTFGGTAIADYALWTNFDLRYKGTNDVHFEKSPPPIPVYE